MKKVIGQQGEVRIIKIDRLPENMESKDVNKISSGYIISHSESGHHHILTGGNVIERTDNIPQGMQVFYAILEQSERFIQDTANPHGEFNLDSGIYEFRISREYNPFIEEARRVMD